MPPREIKSTNPMLQRTRRCAPLSRKPLGGKQRRARRYVMNRVLLTGLVVSQIVSAAPTPTPTQRQDDAEIREVQVRQAEAWNRHGAAAYATLFTEDGDVVNVD